GQGRSPLLHPVDPDDAADRGRHPDLSHVPRGRAARQPDRNDPALYGRQSVAFRMAAQGLHGRDPEGVRGGGDDRRLYALSGFRSRRAAPGLDRDRGHGHLLPDLLVERICLRRASDLGRRTDHPTLHPVHHRRRWSGLAGGRRGNDALSHPDRRIHNPFAQAPAARHHLRSGSAMSALMDENKARGRFPRRGSLENFASFVIVAGVVMLMQPFWLELYSYSFATILAGTVMFAIVSKIPD